ncbi:hypothetical protein RSOL_336570, partial [Rhizoctonia solani AG-3 Rhs1AP]
MHSRRNKRVSRSSPRTPRIREEDEIMDYDSGSENLEIEGLNDFLQQFTNPLPRTSPAPTPAPSTSKLKWATHAASEPTLSGDNPYLVSYETALSKLVPPKTFLSGQPAEYHLVQWSSRVATIIEALFTPYQDIKPEHIHPQNAESMLGGLRAALLDKDGLPLP